MIKRQSIREFMFMTSSLKIVSTNLQNSFGVVELISSLYKIFFNG